MMQRLVRLAGILCPAFLVSIGLFLAWKNYTPGTFLIGWDSLHPEFNFSLAFERAFTGVWRAEQGVGAIAAHSHMADLPRILLLWLSSFVLPVSFLRYFYIFLCLILGPLGVYFFLKYVFEREKDGLGVILASFLGGAFYLLNLVTLQHFYVPFEMFTTEFAFLPWLFLYALRFLREGKKNLLVFALLSILSSPMAYAATAFYSYFAVLVLFLFSYSLISGRINVSLKRSIGLLIVVLALNSYWILPNIYSAINQSATIENAKVNRLFSPEAFLRNQEYGDFKGILIGKSFLFDWRAYDFNKNTYEDLLGIWNKYLLEDRVLSIGYGMAALSILGFLAALIKRNKVGVALLVPTILSIFFLLNNNPPTGAIYNYLYQNISVFREGFRMPFTKFSIPFVFFLSFYLAYFFNFIFRRTIFSLLVTAGVIIGLVYFMLPAFGGELIHPGIRRQIPQEYFQAFSWFNSHPSGRVAELPMHTQWGWGYRSWGYEGSGFLTFGVANPTLDRDFDRWSAFNENFYNEASTAIYSQDPRGLENVLEKYQVGYLLLDESTVNAGGSEKLLFIPETKKLLGVSPHIKEATHFGFVRIYQTDFPKEEISAPNKLYEESKTLDVGKALVGASLISSEDFSQNRGFPQAYNCDLKKVGQVGKVNLGNKIVYKAENGGVSCDFFDYPDLSYSQAYIIRIKGQNKEGRSLKIYLQNKETNRMDLEELLPGGDFDAYYLISSKNMSGKGYTLNLETRAFGRIASQNLIEKIEFYPFIYTSNLNPEAVENNLTIKNIKKYGTWLYKVDVEGSGLIELGQGYESGWTALTMADGQWQMVNKLQHVKINSWANGWMLSQPLTVFIFFWPQLLEYLGLAVLVGTLALVAKSNY